MCLYPQFVQRRDIDRLIGNGFNAVVCGEWYRHITKKIIVKTKSGTQLKLAVSDYSFDPDDPQCVITSPKHKIINADRHFVKHYQYNMEDFYITNSETGELEPLFVQVPCGYCESADRQTRMLQS